MAQKGETLVEVKDLCKNFGVTDCTPPVCPEIEDAE